MKKSCLPLISLFGLCLLTACGGSGGPAIPPFGPITQFSVSAPATATAGTAISVIVTARDASNNVVANYTGTVQFSSSDGQAALPTPMALRNGTGTFQVTFKTVPAQTIMVVDTATGLIAGNSGAITVNAGPVSQLVFMVPGSATTGLAVNLTVTAFDAFNNTATNYTGTLHFTSSDPKAAPPQNSILTAGVGNFSATLNSTGPQFFTATDTVTASITGKSGTINVFTNAATHFSIGTPGNALTRQALSVPVTALDGAGNTSLGYSGTVHISSTDPKALLPADSMLANGSQAFPVTLESAGNWTITATDKVTPTLTITSPSIAVAAPAALAITSNPPPPGTAGVNYAPSKTEIFRCTLYIRVLVCTPCNSPACAALPPCGRGISPCRETRQVFGGFTFAATGGIPPYGWSATGLPPGLTVNSVTGEILGTPTTPGNFTVNVTLNDSGNPVAQFPMSYPLVIATPPAPVINTTPAPPAGALNLPYSFTFTASSLAPSLVWSVSAGAPPPGLSLAPTGVLSGTPTTVGTFPMTLIATDSFNQPSAPQQFQILIAAHGFAATGSLITERLLHTAITLGSGEVLIIGGQKENGVPLASAELYTPASGTFASTGSMSTVRTCHTATLLQNGMVLVAGGNDATGTALATAELYNPGNGSFALTGSMGTARYCPTAVLLGNGQVLITGGIDSTGVLASAEIYDPIKGMFAPTAGSMSTVRTDHTATLITNTSTGKVLVTGGNTGGPATAAADLFDPTTGMFTPTGPMGTARFFHTATLLGNGKVLVAGGTDSTGAAFSSAELFDPGPGGGTFAPTGPMATARAIHTATLLMDGTVLVAGGEVTSGNDTATAELYDPNAATFAPVGSMGTAREYHAAALLADGKRVLIAGGRTGDGSAALASAELYQ